VPLCRLKRACLNGSLSPPALVNCALFAFIAWPSRPPSQPSSPPQQTASCCTPSACRASALRCAALPQNASHAHARALMFADRPDPLPPTLSHRCHKQTASQSRRRRPPKRPRTPGRTYARWLSWCGAHKRRHLTHTLSMPSCTQLLSAPVMRCSETLPLPVPRATMRGWSAGDGKEGAAATAPTCYRDAFSARRDGGDGAGSNCTKCTNHARQQSGQRGLWRVSPLSSTAAPTCARDDADGMCHEHQPVEEPTARGGVKAWARIGASGLKTRHLLQLGRQP
jgi:hypothetical protein